MQKKIDATHHYCSFHLVKGILDPSPDLNSILLKDEKIEVRLLGLDAYEGLIAKLLLPLDVGETSSLNSKARGDFELKLNTLMHQMSRHAVMYVESSLPTDDVMDFYEEGSELPAYVKAPLKLNAESAFKSASSVMTFVRGSNLSRVYDFVFEQYYVTDSQSTIIQKLHPRTIFEENLMAPLDMEEVRVAESLLYILHKDKDLKRIIDLYSESLRPYESGHLHAFIAAWTALEMFILKQFNDLKSSVTVNINGSKAHEVFSSRVFEVMNDKYRLVDKFVVLSNYYNIVEVDADIKVLKDIKCIRDDFFHSMRDDINDLPLIQTRKLFTKYFLVSLERRIEGFNFQRSEISKLVEND
ncbi:MAG: hypothetical protein Q7T48_06875 [Cellvibrio sp.]|uniref:hypothetical protein n=1 Tax=Cellvibrio sp. TaxID=1965322 RepID=UPI00271A6D59|nr:hypothetical protein [Cellvibrio sp.]